VSHVPPSVYFVLYCRRLNKIWRGVQIVKFLIVYSPASTYFVPHGSEYSLSTSLMKTPRLYSSLMWGAKFHVHTREQTFFCVRSSGREDKIFCNE
jgi:hypothetical protein